MPSTKEWRHPSPAPVVVIKSAESVLTDRVVQALAAEVVHIYADSYTPGDLVQLTSPSLFGEPPAVVVHRVGAMSEDFLKDALAYVGAPEPNAMVILRYEGGTRGAKVLTAASKAGFPTVEVPRLSYESDKVEYVADEVAHAGRSIERDAAQFLVNAVGRDAGDLIAALSQLLTDIEGRITMADVRTYYAGRVEATGFDVSDAVIAGHTGKALALARHAMETGTTPVALIAAIAATMRQLALVVGRFAPAYSIDPEVSNFQARKVRPHASRWTHKGLDRAFRALATADAEIKGEAKSREYAVERAIIDITRARQAGRR